MAKGLDGCIICDPDPCTCGPAPKARKAAAPKKNRWESKTPLVQGTAVASATEGSGVLNGPAPEAVADRWAKQVAVRSDLDIALDALVPIMHDEELARYGKRRKDVPSQQAQEWRARRG